LRNCPFWAEKDTPREKKVFFSKIFFQKKILKIFWTSKKILGKNIFEKKVFFSARKNYFGLKWTVSKIPAFSLAAQILENQKRPF